MSRSVAPIFAEARAIDPGQGATASARRRRDRRALLTAVTGYLSRFTGLAVSIVTVPLLLHHLGTERYGVWLTVSAGAAWVGIVHLGIAPSLLTRLSILAPNDASGRREAVSSAVVISVMIAATAALVILGLAASLPWAAVLNVTDPVIAEQGRLAATALWLSVAIGLPISAAMAVARGRQEGFRANAVELATVLVRLAILVALVGTAASMGLLGLGVAGASVVVGTVGAVWVLATAPPEFRPSLRAFSVPAARLLATSGAAFTAISVAALLISYTDVIIISQVLGPASVPAYAVPYSLLTVFISLILVALDAMWPAFGEAASIGDGTWLRAAHRRVVFGCLAASIVFAIAIATAGPFVIRIWAGDAVVPPAGLLLVLGAIAVIQGFELPYGRILIATGRVRGYALAGLLNAAINLPLSIILARPLGIVGVALGTLIGYVLLAPPLIVWARRALRDVEGERT